MSDEDQVVSDIIDSYQELVNRKDLILENGDIPVLPLSPKSFNSEMDLSMPLNAPSSTITTLNEYSDFQKLSLGPSFKSLWEINKDKSIAPKKSMTPKTPVPQSRVNNTVKSTIVENVESSSENLQPLKKDVSIVNEPPKSDLGVTSSVEKKVEEVDLDDEQESISSSSDIELEEVISSKESSTLEHDEVSEDVEVDEEMEIEIEKEIDSSDNVNTVPSSNLNYEELQNIAFVIPSTNTGMAYDSDDNEKFEEEIEDIVLLGSKPPKYSSFPQKEHTLYLDLTRKYQLDQIAKQREPHPKLRLTSGEIQLYMRMKMMVDKERAEYHQWILKENFGAFNQYSKIAQDSIEIILSHYRERIISYPRFYNSKIQMNLLDSKFSPTIGDSVLTHKKTLLNIGIVPEWIEPRNLPFKLSSVLRFTSKNKIENTNWKQQEMPELSKDPTLEELLSANPDPINICVSSSTMQTLVDSIPPNFENQFEIPFIVKEIDTINGIRKVVIMDKPFIKHTMNLREKNTKYSKLAVKSNFLHKDTPGIRIFPPVDGIPSPTPQLQEEGYNLTYNEWKFGELSILVRCGIKGVKKESQSFRYIGVKAKTEYLLQGGFGYEVISPSERARWWMYTFLRPDAHLTIARFNVITSEVSKLENLTMQDILSPSCGFNPAVSSKIIHTIFLNIVNLPVGNYILAKTSGDRFVHILESIPVGNETNNFPSIPKVVDTSTNELESDDEELMIIDDDEDNGNTDNNIESTKQKEEIPQKLIEPIKYDYDLHKTHTLSGQTDMGQVPYLAPMWLSSSTIPYTFPIAPKKKKFKRKTPKKRPTHCFSFAKTGSCSKGDKCQYPHISGTKINPSKSKRKSKQARKSFTDWDRPEP